MPLLVGRVVAHLAIVLMAVTIPMSAVLSMAMTVSIVPMTSTSMIFAAIMPMFAMLNMAVVVAMTAVPVMARLCVATVAVLILIQEALIDLHQHAVQREGLYAEKKVHVNLRVLCPFQCCSLVDSPDLTLHHVKLCRIYQIRLVQQDPVRKSNLFDSLVHSTLGLLLPKLRHDVLGVYNGQNAVKHHIGTDKLVCKESLGHRCWVCEAGGLNDDTIQGLALATCLLMKFLEPGNQITAHRAANAAIVHFNDVLLRDRTSCVQQLVIDANLPELVLNDRYPATMVVLQDVVQQRRLASTKEAGDDAGRGFLDLLRAGPCQKAFQLCLLLQQGIISWQ
mmetsp:Transcript_54403/g.102024  ORF Transcript_54403/g.102024 Transcript_54403/m.102024 type:complete len:336 (+) Transcript_54403:719-1726(+)